MTIYFGYLKKPPTKTKMYKKNNILLKTIFVQWFQNERVLIHIAQPMTNSSPVGGWSTPSGQTVPVSCFPQGPKSKYICSKINRYQLKQNAHIFEELKSCDQLLIK